MDSMSLYREIIQQVLREHTKIPYVHGDVQFETIFDPAVDRYLLMTVGWENDRRIHGCLVHLDMINGKVWIQRDGTEEGIANELVQAGIPKGQIVLAFHPPDVRPLTEFAIG